MDICWHPNMLTKYNLDLYVTFFPEGRCLCLWLPGMCCCKLKTVKFEYISHLLTSGKCYNNLTCVIFKHILMTGAMKKCWPRFEVLPFVKLPLDRKYNFFTMSISLLDWQHSVCKDNFYSAIKFPQWIDNVFILCADVQHEASAAPPHAQSHARQQPQPVPTQSVPSRHDHGGRGGTVPLQTLLQVSDAVTCHDWLVDTMWYQKCH